MKESGPLKPNGLNNKQLAEGSENDSKDQVLNDIDNDIIMMDEPTCINSKVKVINNHPNQNN